MKKLLLFLFALLPLAAFAQGKRISLQIGINQYPAPSGWASIHGENDLDMLGPAFHAKGFEVIQLRGRQATLAAIMQSFDNLVAQAQIGDGFHIHFSLHGQQIPDDNGDEFDALDEALIPYDAFSSPNNGYLGETHLRDDLLGKVAQTMREKTGRNGFVWITLDACHSGTATRGNAPMRGAPYPFGEHAPPAKRDPGIWDGLADSRANLALAPLVIFSSTTAVQMNREYLAGDGRFYGPLSYGLVKAMNQQIPETYAGLFEQVRQQFARIAPRQTPQQEGAAAGIIWKKPGIGEGNLFPVIKVWDHRRLVLGKGLLHGVFPGAAFQLFSQDNPLAVLATGTTVRLGLQETEILLDQPVSPDRVSESVVQLSPERTAGHWLRVQRKNLSPPSVQEWQSLIQNTPGLLFTDDPPDLYIEEQNRQLTIRTRTGVVLFQEKSPDPSLLAEQAFRGTVLPLAQAHLLKQIPLHLPAPRVDLHFFSEEIRPDKEMNPPFSLQIGQTFRIQIANQEERDLFFCLIDIPPDNACSILQPQAFNKGEPGDWLIKAGERKMFEPVFRVNPPKGEETLLLLVSEMPISINLYSKTTERSPSLPVSRSLPPYGPVFEGVKVYRLSISE